MIRLLYTWMCRMIALLVLVVGLGRGPEYLYIHIYTYIHIHLPITYRSFGSPRVPRNLQNATCPRKTWNSAWKSAGVHDRSFCAYQKNSSDCRVLVSFRPPRLVVQILALISSVAVFVGCLLELPAVRPYTLLVPG